jgi:hypothetical protein
MQIKSKPKKQEKNRDLKKNPKNSWWKKQYFNFSEGNEKTLLKLGIQSKNTRSTLKIAVCGC